MRILSALIFLISAGFANATGDIFSNGIWYNGNHTLTTNYHESLPWCSNCNYSVSYIIKEGTYASDSCYKSSNISLNCPDLDNVRISYNAELHKMTVYEHGVPKYYYYDKGYMPTTSPVSGTWNAPRGSGCQQETNILIPYAEYNAKTFYPVKWFDETGFIDYTTLYLKKDHDGYLHLTNGYDYMSPKFYLIDIHGNKIKDVDKVSFLREYFQDKLTNCIYSKSVLRKPSM